MKHTLKEIRESLAGFHTHSCKNGIFTVRMGFFYRMGKDANYCKMKVLDVFPDAKIIDFGEKYKPFRGSASVANQSHWFVKFTLPEN